MPSFGQIGNSSNNRLSAQLNGLAYSHQSSNSHLNEPLLAAVQENDDEENHIQVGGNSQYDIFSSRKNQFIIFLLVLVPCLLIALIF